MSTVYYSKTPMTIAEAIEKTGWRIHSYDHDVTILTDETNYIHVSEIEWGGFKYLDAERFGANDAEEFVNVLDLISEHDEGFWEMPWNAPIEEN